MSFTKYPVILESFKATYWNSAQSEIKPTQGHVNDITHISPALYNFPKFPQITLIWDPKNPQFASLACLPGCHHLSNCWNMLA